MPYRLAALVAATSLGLALVADGLAAEGWATWYGADFHGQRMANGQIFDMYDPTIAAANQLPLGTWLRVENPQNGHSILVQVRDRGLFAHALDLSYAAFSRLAPPSRGRLWVRYEVVDPPATLDPADRPLTLASRGGPRDDPPVHIVAPGETLWAIARRYGTTALTLATENHLANPDLIYPGQVLRLPLHRP